MELADAAALVDPQPLPLEMGVERLDSGHLLVAARTDMSECKGRMFEWWFRFAPDTQQYVWWHPLDHPSSYWCDTNGRTHVGATHVITERFGAYAAPTELLVQFVDPAELFGTGEVAAASERGDVSAIIYGHGGHAELGRDDAGRAIGTRVLRLARDAEWGVVLRTRFWMGAGIPEDRACAILDKAGLDLMQLAHAEFHYLEIPAVALHRREPTCGGDDAAMVTNRTTCATNVVNATTAATAPTATRAIDCGNAVSVNDPAVMVVQAPVGWRASSAAASSWSACSSASRSTP